MQRGHGGNAQRPGCDTAEQVGVLEMRVHDVGPDLGQVASDAGQGTEVAAFFVTIGSRVELWFLLALGPVLLGLSPPAGARTLTIGNRPHTPCK